MDDTEYQLTLVKAKNIAKELISEYGTDKALDIAELNVRDVTGFSIWKMVANCIMESE
ncbi:MAG: hypothetical protein WCS17_14045 [Prevotella sp.]